MGLIEIMIASKKRNTFWVNVAFFGLLGFAPVAAWAQGPGAMASPAREIPTFRFARHDQRIVSNADLPAGKLVLFVFFDPDCEHCKRALTHMDHEYADYRAAAIYFVSMEAQDKIDKFMTTYTPRLAAQHNVVFVRDAGAMSMVLFHPVRFPSFFLYSPEHKLLDFEDNEETLFRIKRSIAAFAGRGK